MTNLLRAVLKKIPGAPEGFEIRRAAKIGTDATQIWGGVTDKVYQRGPKKGRPDWRGVAYTEVVVTDAEILAAGHEYEASTGNCSHCNGTGSIWAGWSIGEGTRYEACPLCKGTGKTGQTKT